MSQFRCQCPWLRCVAFGALPIVGLWLLNAGPGVAKEFSSDSENTPPNIILIISDQESFHLQAPVDYALPARDELKRRGVTFQNHYIASAMCTPSRAVMFSGQPPQVNGVFDQMELGYVPSMSAERPSLGTVMKQLGYSTAYFGKFELDRNLIKPNDTTNYTSSLRKYGFDVFPADGDKTGAPDQGYDTDVYTVGSANRWLRTHGQKLNSEGKPWFVVVSMINPHDIMYTDANLPGQRVQVSVAGGTLTTPPDNQIYRKQWDFALYSSLDEPFNLNGRPDAQWQYLQGWSSWVGFIPTDRRDMWRKYYNCYLNFMRDNDQTLQSLLDTMTELALWENTAVVLTADHGELAGSHGGLRGKGPFAYEQMAHVPFIVSHPNREAGKECEALTSHIDLLPTIVGLSGRSQSLRKQVTAGMSGRDLTFLLDDPESADAHTARKAVLFNYVGLQLIDAKYFRQIAPLQARREFVPPLTERHPDLNKRGFMSFVFDGQHKFVRYYSPAKFNTPATLDEIFGNNDLELFDLKTDPEEVVNLAVDREKNGELVLRMNRLLNAMMTREVGNNDGEFLPQAVRPAGSQ